MYWQCPALCFCSTPSVWPRWALVCITQSLDSSGVESNALSPDVEEKSNDSSDPARSPHIAPDCHTTDCVAGQGSSPQTPVGGAASPHPDSATASHLSVCQWCPRQRYTVKPHSPVEPGNAGETRRVLNSTRSVGACIPTQSVGTSRKARWKSMVEPLELASPSIKIAYGCVICTVPTCGNCCEMSTFHATCSKSQ
jgi:hypothetical protein